MKKLLSIFVILAVSMSLFACSAKLHYTKEFPYLPSYENYMILKTYTPASKNPSKFGNAQYIIINSNKNDMLEKYETVLKSDGWTVTQDKKTTSIVVKKGTHQAALTIGVQNNNLILYVLSN